MTAVVPLPGIPKVNIGTKEPEHAALFAVSGADNPFTLPFPNFSFSSSFTKFLSIPYAKNDAIVAPAPGNTPIKKPITEDLGIVRYILPRSSLLILIDPSSVSETCFAAAVGSFRFNMIVKASLMANVDITTKTKLIPSVKFILSKVNLVISDRES